VLPPRKLEDKGKLLRELNEDLGKQQNFSCLQMSLKKRSRSGEKVMDIRVLIPSA